MAGNIAVGLLLFWLPRLWQITISDWVNSLHFTILMSVCIKISDKSWNSTFHPLVCFSDNTSLSSQLKNKMLLTVVSEVSALSWLLDLQCRQLDYYSIRMSISCYFILLLHVISEGRIVVFTPLHLFESYSKIYSIAYFVRYHIQYKHTISL